jgi:hypothetical protein
MSIDVDGHRRLDSDVVADLILALRYRVAAEVPS